VQQNECCQLVGGTPTGAVETTALPIYNCIELCASVAYADFNTLSQAACQQKSMHTYYPRRIARSGSASPSEAMTPALGFIGVQRSFASNRRVENGL